MSTLGIDISTWQATTPNLTGLSFVICRATYGTGKDTRYDMHSANVLKAGKVLGAYHFGRRAVDRSIAAQVSAFLSVAGNAQLLALDLESDQGTLMSNTDAAAFIKALRATDPRHRKIVLYHSLSGFPTNLGQDGNWIAKWSSTPPSLPWVIWQNNNAYKGSSSNGDGDIYNGTDAQLRAWVGGTTAGPLIPTPPSGGSMARYVNANGYLVHSGLNLHVKAGTPIYGLDGSLIEKWGADYDVEVLGRVDGKAGHYLVKYESSKFGASATTGPLQEVLATVKTSVKPSPE